MVTQVLPPGLQDAVTEVAPYLLHSFGNAVRLDYGTGHETTFVAFLYCLAATGRASMINVLLLGRGKGMGGSV